MTELTEYSPFSFLFSRNISKMDAFLCSLLPCCAMMFADDKDFFVGCSSLLTISKLKESKRGVRKSLCCSSNETDIDRMLLPVAQLKTLMMDTINERVS
jgi:hypothetical protein